MSVKYKQDIRSRNVDTQQKLEKTFQRGCEAVGRVVAPREAKAERGETSANTTEPAKLAIGFSSELSPQMSFIKVEFVCL